MSVLDDIMTALLTRQARKEEVRAGYDGARQKAFDYVNPRRYDMSGSVVKGSQRRTKMYDGVAQEAHMDWVDGILGWGVSESLQWQKASMRDRRFRDDDSVQRHLDEYTEQMEWEFRASNFYDVEPEYLQDASGGGTGTITTEESLDLSRAVHRVPHPGMVWIAEDGEGTVNSYHEKLTLTARQVFDRFNRPDDRLHETVRKWARSPGSSLWDCVLLQCILPADDKAIFPQRMTWKKWALVTMLYEMHGGSGVVASDLEVKAPKDRMIRVEGVDYFSPTVWRFRKNSDELYGYSPAMDILTVIETAQQHAYNLLNMGNLAANPIMNIPEEGRLEFSRLPGSDYHFGSENRVASAVEMNREYPIAVDREEKIHALIRKRYGWHVWNAVLSLQNKKERVQATEVMEVRADQARLLTGQFNNFWRQGIKPVWNNVARIAERAGRLPEPPGILDEVRGKDLIDIDFIGPFSWIQSSASKLGGLQNGLNLLASVAEIVGRHIAPEEAAEIYDRVRLPDLAEYICDNTSFPQRLMRSDDDVNTRVAARRQQIAAQAQAKQTQQLAAASAQYGKPIDQSSLLAAMGA